MKTITIKILDNGSFKSLKNIQFPVTIVADVNDVVMNRDMCGGIEILNHYFSDFYGYEGSNIDFMYSFTKNEHEVLCEI